MPFRNAVRSALERRHAEIGKLWAETLEGVDITTSHAGYRKALMQIKGAPMALANITIAFALSLIVC